MPGPSGFDPGNIPPQQHGNQGQNNPAQIPSGGSPHRPISYSEDLVQNSMYGTGVPADNLNASFNIRIHNHTNENIHFAILKGGVPHRNPRNTEPVHGLYFACISPNQDPPTSASGEGERILAAWDCTTGSFLGASALNIVGDTTIVVQPSIGIPGVRISATQRKDVD